MSEHVGRNVFSDLCEARVFPEVLPAGLPGEPPTGTVQEYDFRRSLLGESGPCLFEVEFKFQEGYLSQRKDPLLTSFSCGDQVTDVKVNGRERERDNL